MDHRILQFNDSSIEGPSYLNGNSEWITYAEYCDFCESPLRGFDNHAKCELDCPYTLHEDIEWERFLGPYRKTHLGVCEKCGFWLVWDDKYMVGQGKDYSYRYVTSRAARGVLKQYDNDRSADAPLGELRAYLLANYKHRYSINPFHMEALVASIYRSMGYSVQLTPKSRDDGVDIYLTERGSKVAAVQVKRYKNKIEAEQIRAFAGAILLSNLNNGIFVTTSQFTRGAVTTAERFKTASIQMSLVDATVLLDLLGSGLRSAYKFPVESQDSYPFLTYLLTPDSLPFLGDAMYAEGIALKSCRTGFDQAVVEIDRYNLRERTLRRANRVESELLEKQLGKLRPFIKHRK